MAWPHLQCVCRSLHSHSLEIADDREIVGRCLFSLLLLRTASRRIRHRVGLCLRGRARPRAASAPIPRELTAAHRTLPFGTRVKVTNQKNGLTVTVRINDRGPFKRRPHHRPDAGRGAEARLRRACPRHPQLDVDRRSARLDRHVDGCSPAGRSARNPDLCAYAPSRRRSRCRRRSARPLPPVRAVHRHAMAEIVRLVRARARISRGRAPPADAARFAQTASRADGTAELASGSLGV